VKRRISWLIAALGLPAAATAFAQVHPGERMLTLTAEQLWMVCAGAAVGGAIYGVMGFAYGVVISLFVHHAFAAPDVVFIIVGGSLIMNLALLPRFWREIRWRGAAPYLLGAVPGMPLGLWLLANLDPQAIRISVGVLIVVYGLYALRQQSREPLRFTAARGSAMDGVVGFAGGVIGGVSGLGPIVPGVWFGLRGMSKIEQRSLAQPFALLFFGAMAAILLATGKVGPQALEALVVATPLMLGAAFLGLLGFDRLNTSTFQRAVVALAILGAVVLLMRQWQASSIEL
jgi:uncharacterized membrane protein YfcA